MEIKRTIEFFVETRRRFVVANQPQAEKRSCPACDEPMLAAEQAAAFFQINCRLLYRLIERSAAHFVETETGASMVCLAWLETILRGAQDSSTEMPFNSVSAEQKNLDGGKK
jgi:hypothetical protein